MKKILTYLKHSMKKCIIVLLITFVLLGIQILLPLFTREVLNNIQSTLSFSTVVIGLAVYAVLLLIYNIIDVCWYSSLDYLGGDILGSMRTDLMTSMFYASYKKIMQYGFEKAKNVLYMDTLSIYGCLTVQLVNIISNGLLMMVFSVLSFFVDVRLGMVLLLVEFCSLLISVVTRKKISGASGAVNRVMKRNNQMLNEYVDSLETARNNYLLDYFLEKERSINTEFIGEAVKSDKYLIALKNISKHFHQWASLLISALLILLIQGSSGDLVYALLVLDIVLGASEGIESSIYQLMKSKPAFEYVNKINDMMEEREYASLKDVNEIRFEDVSFGYGKENIIEHLSCVFKKGDIVHIKGKNGSGKSTFIKLLTSLLQADSGNIVFDGVNVNQLDPGCLHELLVYVSQDETLLNESFADYLRIMTEGQNSYEEIEKTIAEFSINREDDRIENLGLSLSGGQRKKLLFAKLKLREKKTPIIIMDELENAMDIGMREELEKYKQYLYKNRDKHIIFVISHEATENEFYTKELCL